MVGCPTVYIVHTTEPILQPSSEASSGAGEQPHDENDQKRHRCSLSRLQPCDRTRPRLHNNLPDYTDEAKATLCKSRDHSQSDCHTIAQVVILRAR